MSHVNDWDLGLTIKRICNCQFIFMPHTGFQMTDILSKHVGIYHISRPIRRTFSKEKCDLNSTCVLCAEGKYYFQTYKYLYPYQVKTTMKMTVVAVMTIFWVHVMNKLYYGC